MPRKVVVVEGEIVEATYFRQGRNSLSRPPVASTVDLRGRLFFIGSVRRPKVAQDGTITDVQTTDTFSDKNPLRAKKEPSDNTIVYKRESKDLIIMVKVKPRKQH